MNRNVVGVVSLCTVLVSSACGAHGRSGEEAEVARIRAHFDSVLVELRSHTPEGLTRAQLQARQESIGWLAGYRDRGVFPHNHVRPERAVPVFVDLHGTPCAVGYLLLRSGEEALVEAVVRQANLALVPELSGEERLLDWLDRRGLTLAEAARIQPTYGPLPPEPEPEPSRYVGETVGLSLVTAAAIAHSELTEPNVDRVAWSGWTNVASLVLHGILLVAAGDEEASAPGWQTGVNVAGMVLSGVAAGRRFARRSDLRQEVARDGEETRVAVLPYLGSEEGRVTMGVTLRH